MPHVSCIQNVDVIPFLESYIRGRHGWDGCGIDDHGKSRIRVHGARP